MVGSGIFGLIRVFKSDPDIVVGSESNFRKGSDPDPIFEKGYIRIRISKNVRFGSGLNSKIQNALNIFVGYSLTKVCFSRI